MDFQRSVVSQLAYDEAVTAVRAALSAQGFGVVTEIDMRATLAKKIGVEIEPYLILGACAPALAHQALQIDHRVGVLLPCNVTVSERDGQTHVAIMDPRIMTTFTGTDALAPVADEAARRLNAVLDAVSAGTR